MLREPPYDGSGGNDGSGSDRAPSIADVLRAALTPIAGQIDVAFIYGPLARGAIKPHGDVDIMIIGRAIAYAEVIPRFIAAAKYLGRSINPSVYCADEWKRKLVQGNRVILAVMQQPKIFVIGSTERIPQAS